MKSSIKKIMLRSILVAVFPIIFLAMVLGGGGAAVRGVEQQLVSSRKVIATITVDGNNQDYANWASSPIEATSQIRLVASTDIIFGGVVIAYTSSESVRLEILASKVVLDENGEETTEEIALGSQTLATSPLSASTASFTQFCELRLGEEIIFNLGANLSLYEIYVTDIANVKSKLRETKESENNV